MRKERAMEMKESDVRLIEVQMINENAMHKRMLKYYEKNVEAPILKEKKKILEEIRQFKKPIDHAKINEHMKDYKKI